MMSSGSAFLHLYFTNSMLRFGGRPDLHTRSLPQTWPAGKFEFDHMQDVMEHPWFEIDGITFKGTHCCCSRFALVMTVAMVSTEA